MAKDLERHLVGWGNAEYVLDLSNIVRPNPFGGPGKRTLRRLVLVLDALVRLTGDPDVGVYLVADRSLRTGRGRAEFTDPSDADRLDRWVADGLVEEVDEADERILELASAGLPVISGDLYVGHRDLHPWIQGDTERFLKPVKANEAGSAVRLIPQDMGLRPAYEISRHGERDVHKAMGLLDRRRRPLLRYLGRAWRCQDPRCTLYDVRKRQGNVFPPRIRGNVAVCAVHGTPLLDDGPRPRATQLKVLITGGATPVRYTLSEGSERVIGRHVEAGIALFDLLDRDVAARISKEHLVVTFRDGKVLVRDISRPGTWMRSARRNFGFGEWTLLDPGADYAFHLGDEVKITEGVVLTRSGQLFPNEVADAWKHAAPKRRQPQAAADAPTILR
ncbi:conserved hypothetical protein [Parafrankia sp. Ea1.12]|uniref:FHA domain-containing protein n=1 Tax=Parafrankia sp. Ea1.12 TaxID=573499 RepID=UPI000DA5BA4D|nr:FHA domain-containing protein [Parafrankia sp. Ea1.12]SQD94985.1 conserved hypothetical protein [Parafrankia sp. Ea1.12]